MPRVRSKCGECAGRGLGRLRRERGGGSGGCCGCDDVSDVSADVCDICRCIDLALLLRGFGCRVGGVGVFEALPTEALPFVIAAAARSSSLIGNVCALSLRSKWPLRIARLFLSAWRFAKLAEGETGAEMDNGAAGAVAVAVADPDGAAPRCSSPLRRRDDEAVGSATGITMATGVGRCERASGCAKRAASMDDASY